ncbi:hypothetical protein EXIGLDRAFT_771481 [Exidia glandulosa HHB12029]|uniref:Uncharacterized protein n=1 Tax=Exidia glandulosa HHB12029 TaxID=1314781 RepID=A0A165FZ01_EXIGL|nr:hypothetical protein EXIGLDRAFT_771481 [Exidia glandulosa HHB12029]
MAKANASARDTDRAFNLAQRDDRGLTFSSVARGAAKNVIPDDKLTFNEVCEAKIALLACMEEVGWEQDHLDAFMRFFLTIENHELRVRPHGKETLVRYVATTRAAWYAARRMVKMKFGISPLFAATDSTTSKSS